MSINKQWSITRLKKKITHNFDLTLKYEENLHNSVIVSESDTYLSEKMFCFFVQFKHLEYGKII